jgi:hypothetical protein
VELPLAATTGYQLVNGERRPLPIGSSLKRGVFYWQPGPGFLGDYHFVFENKDGTESHVQHLYRLLRGGMEQLQF